MLWILITVLVGLFVIIVQLLLAYQKRANRLRVAQNPVRKQINDYKNKITEVAEGVRTMASDSLSQLKKDLADYQKRSGHAANLTAELDSEAQDWLAAREGESGSTSADEEFGLNGDDDDEDESEDGEGGIDELLGGRKDAHMRVELGHANPVEIVRSIRHELEQTYEYIEGLRTDASIVQQSLQWLGEEDDGKSKRKANGSK